MQEKQLTQPTFDHDEVWEVYMSNQKEPYLLNERQFAVFIKMLKGGSKGVLCFDDFGINLAFYVSHFLKSRKKKKEFQIEAPKEKEISTEEKERLSEKMKEFKTKFFNNSSTKAIEGG